MAKKVFNMQGGLHSAAAYAAFENRQYGSCVANAASLAVTPGAGMNLNIASGDGLISVDAFLARRIQVTATETAAVPAANASFNRIDTVVAYIDTAVAPTTAVIDNVNDILMFKVVAGTAAATPAAPTGAAIQASIGAGNPYMVLYDVLVPQGATNVAGVTLTDRRKVLTVVDGANLKSRSIVGDKIDFSTFIKRFAHSAGQINYANPANFATWTDLTGSTYTFTPDRDYVFIAMMQIRGGNSPLNTNRGVRILQNGSVVNMEASQAMNSTGQTLMAFYMGVAPSGVATTIKGQFAASIANDIIYSSQLNIFAIPM